MQLGEPFEKLLGICYLEYTWHDSENGVLSEHDYQVGRVNKSQSRMCDVGFIVLCGTFVIRLFS